MNHKTISEAAWKTWAKGRGMNDAALLKQLAAFGKVPDQDAARLLMVLPDLRKQADLLRQAHKADKDATRQLDTLLKEIQGVQQNAEAAQAKAAASARKGDGGDEDDDAPSLLSTVLLTHFKVLKGSDGLSRPFVVGALGTEVAVAIAKSAISPAQRKLVQSHLGGGLVKFLLGQCLYEQDAYTFVLDKSIAGLAKKLRLAIQAQTGKLFKVRVRGTDKADVDHDEDQEETGDRPSTNPTRAAASPSAPDKSPASSPVIGQGQSRAPVDEAAAAAAFTARLARLAPAIKAAMAAGGTMEQALKLKSTEAGTLAKRLEFKAAQATLDTVEALLKKALTPPQPQARTQPPSQAATPRGQVSEGEVRAVKERLTALLPPLKAASESGGEQAVAAKALQAEVITLMRQRQLAQATAVLDRLEALLAGTGERLSAASAVQPPGPDRSRLNASIRERPMLINAQQAYAAYLQSKSTEDDLDEMAAHLQRVRDIHQAWQRSIGDDGAPETRSKMEVLLQKVALEQEILDEVREHTRDMDRVMAAIEASQDHDERAALHGELRELMQSFPA